MTASADNPGLHLSNIIAQTGGVEILTPKPPDLGKAALWYAVKWGWPVFPLHPGQKAPLTAHGFQDASTDPEQVKAWWTREPRANIGVPTGPVEQGGVGLDVLDIDGDKGMATYAELPAGEIPALMGLTFTPGDRDKARGPGRHHWTPSLGDGNSSGFLPGCDWRGAGGFVVVAPSLNPQGIGYTWLLKPEGKP